MTFNVTSAPLLNALTAMDDAGRRRVLEALEAGHKVVHAEFTDIRSSETDVVVFITFSLGRAPIPNTDLWTP